MDSDKQTIAQVLFQSESDPPPKGLALDAAHPKLQALEKDVKRELTAIDWAVVKGKLLQKLAEVLNDPFIYVLTDAWRKHDEIYKYCDENKYPPNVTSLVALAKHTIKSERKPSIEILVDGIRRGELGFTVTFGIDIEGVQLEIQAAKIKRLLSGTWQGFGAIAMEGSEIYKKLLKPGRIPGAISFGDGIPIR